MSYETILYDKGERIATITLNRPETLSSLLPETPFPCELARYTVTREMSAQKRVFS